MSFRVLASVTFLTLSSIVLAAESSDWIIENRIIPPPEGVSEVLKNSIAGTPQPNIEESSRYPDSDEAWEELSSTASIAIPINILEQALSVTIEASQIAGVNVFRVTPVEINSEYVNDLFLYAHGGAYVFNGGEAAISESALIASMAGVPSISIDYRMPPNDPFPAAIEDFVAVYQELLSEVGAENIAVGGSSAGAGLAIASLHRLKELNISLPAVLYAGSPWADLTKTGDTMYTNEGIDRILVTYDGYLKGAAELYADGEELKHPLLSPVYGDFSGFPPTILVSGTRDLFLSDTVRVHRKLRAAGVAADLHVYEAMSHTGYGFMRQAPESQDFYEELNQFLQSNL